MHRLNRAFAVLAVAFFALVIQGSATPAAWDVPLFIGEGCNYQCRDCSGTGSAHHDIVTNFDPSKNNDQASGYEDCNPGTCESYHGCGFQVPHGDGLTIAIGASSAELIDLIQQNPRRVRYNPEREAIQVFCKEGIIVANLPLSKATSDAIAAGLSAN